MEGTHCYELNLNDATRSPGSYIRVNYGDTVWKVKFFAVGEI
jgi:hypothetical protein